MGTKAPSVAPSLETIRDAVSETVKDDTRVIGVYLFGSRAEGEEHPGSDVDLAVLFAERQSLSVLLDLEARLEDAVGTAVDLADLGKVNAFLADKVAIIDRMLRGLRKLPQSSLDELLADDRTPAAAESYLRRALEALLDLGRHLLAKGFGLPVNEYAAIADRLRDVEVLGPERTVTLREMAKYRNRMVHVYDEVTKEEIYEIVTRELRDFEDTIADFNSWLAAHPERVRRNS